MAGVAEQLVVARAEPEECSRWALICLMGCAAVTLVCVSLYLLSNREETTSPSMDFLLRYLLFVLGLFVSAVFLSYLYEQLTGGDPHGEMTIDRLLSL